MGIADTVLMLVVQKQFVFFAGCPFSGSSYMCNVYPIGKTRTYVIWFSISSHQLFIAWPSLISSVTDLQWGYVVKLKSVAFITAIFGEFEFVFRS